MRLGQFVPRKVQFQPPFAPDVMLAGDTRIVTKELGGFVDGTSLREHQRPGLLAKGMKGLDMIDAIPAQPSEQRVKDALAARRIFGIRTRQDIRGRDAMLSERGQKGEYVGRRVDSVFRVPCLRAEEFGRPNPDVMPSKIHLFPRQTINFGTSHAAVETEDKSDVASRVRHP